VLARATVKTLRTWELPGEPVPLYGIAVTIDRIDFAQPSTSTAAWVPGDFVQSRIIFLLMAGSSGRGKNVPGEPMIRPEHGCDGY
jgi:hypothetical protein